MDNKIEDLLKKQNQLGNSTSSIIKASGVSRTQFYAIIKGDCVPKLDTAIKIANALGTKVETLFNIGKKEGEISEQAINEN